MRNHIRTVLALACLSIASLQVGIANAAETETTASERATRDQASRESKPSLDLRNPPPGRVTPAAVPWRDVETCDARARGRVVSAKEESIRGQRGVRVKAKSISGSTLMAGVQRAKESDFPPGAGFCKIDFGRD